MDINWHLKGPLQIKSMYPENGGFVQLTDDSGTDIGIYQMTPAQWWSLYCTLPKTPDFKVYRKNDGALHIGREQREYLSGFINQKDAA